MRLNPAELLSRLNSSYWFVPLMVTLGGAALALVLLRLDPSISLDPQGPLAVLYPSSAEGARALLAAVIGAMITAVSVTLSVTTVAFTVAAQHFGPRVLNNFVRDTAAQVVLGTFMATFVYSLLALGALPPPGEEARYPELTISGAVVLVVLSIGALIFYAHHVSRTLQVSELAAAIATDFRRAVSRTASAADAAAPDTSGGIPEAPQDAATVPARESGYVQRIDSEAIVRLAAERDALVWIRREPGAFVVPGAALALVHPAAACDEVFATALRHACVVGRDRTLWHDPEFAAKQLVEIALRALSPGVNEPFTAITCIDRLTQGLACAATVGPPRHAWCDASGRARLFTQPQPFATLLHAAFDPIRIFAGPNPAIYARLLDSLGELALLTQRADDQRLLRAEADVIRRAAGEALRAPEDLDYVEGRYQQCLRQCAGRPGSTRR